MHLEKCSLNFSSLSFAIRVNLLHPHSFLVYYYFFGVFLSYQTKCCVVSFTLKVIMKTCHENYHDVAPLNSDFSCSHSFECYLYSTHLDLFNSYTSCNKTTCSSNPSTVRKAIKKLRVGCYLNDCC